MRAQVPVVATRAGSLPEVLGEGALMVEPGDADALAAAIETCLSDGRARETLVAAGTACSARYSWQRCGDGLEALYRDAVDGARRA
jgi:alpha-1,3-rhamnosyl/mannosyltransferase